MTKFYFSLASAMLTIGLAGAQTRYVDAGGTDAGDCSLPGSPCATISYAVSEAVAGDSVVLAPGNYAFTSTQLIEKAVTVSAASIASKPVITTSASEAITINADNVTIHGLRLQLGLTAGSGLKGIVSSGSFNNLTITNNEILSSKALATGMVFGSYAIHLYGAAGQTVNIQNNIIGPLNGLANDNFGRGLGLGLNGAGVAPGGVINNNGIAAYYTIHYTVPSASATITNNIMAGIFMYNSPVAGTSTTISNNTFDPLDPALANNLYALLELRSIDNATLNIDNNDFLNYTNIAILNSSSNGVNITNNTFTPHATASAPVAVHANTKTMTTGVESYTYANSFSLTGNTFNAPAAGVGTALQIATHYQNTNGFANVQIGSANAQNIFDSNLQHFIVLDSLSGPSSSFALWAPYAVTAMTPVSQDFNAWIQHNNYGTNNLSVIGSKITDLNDNSNLGRVILDPTGTRYVGTAGNNSGNDCLDPNSPCADVDYAHNVAFEGDSIVVFAGNYTWSSTLNISKRGITLTASDINNKPVITSSVSDVLEVSAEKVSINGLQFELGLSAANGLRGIVATTGYDSLSITNNHILSVKPLSTGMVFGAYGIAIYGGNGLYVNISDNEVRSAAAANDAFGRATGLGLNGFGQAPGGVVKNNLLQAYYPIQATVPSADILIEENQLAGLTMINAAVNGIRIDLTNNVFDGVNDQVAASLYALLEVRANDGAIVNIQDNEFKNYLNIGLFSSASRNVKAIGNEFNPSATATDFVSIHANSKLMTTGVQNNTYANDIEIKGNTFNAGLSDNGTAIAFADHYGATATAFADSIKIGGDAAADKNVFASELRYFIALDSLSGSSNNFTLWVLNGSSVTTMKPFSQHIYAFTDWNTYPSNDTLLLEEKAFDVVDASVLGNVFFVRPDFSSNESEIISLATYPNPVVNTLNIAGEGLNGNGVLTITDMLGRVVRTQNINAAGSLISIPVQDLSNGMYNIRITAGTAIYQARIIKN